MCEQVVQSNQAAAGCAAGYAAAAALYKVQVAPARWCIGKQLPGLCLRLAADAAHCASCGYAGASVDACLNA
jgi:hypothetical protein